MLASGMLDAASQAAAKKIGIRMTIGKSYSAHEFSSVIASVLGR